MRSASFTSSQGHLHIHWQRRLLQEGNRHMWGLTGTDRCTDRQAVVLLCMPGSCAAGVANHKYACSRTTPKWLQAKSSLLLVLRNTAMHDTVIAKQVTRLLAIAANAAAMSRGRGKLPVAQTPPWQNSATGSSCASAPFTMTSVLLCMLPFSSAQRGLSGAAVLGVLDDRGLPWLGM